MAKKVKTKKEPNAELKAQLARALADYDNLQKRVEREGTINRHRMTLQIISTILPSIDMIENVQTHIKDSGLAMALAQFEDALKDLDIEVIKPSMGDKFDEQQFEAIEAVEDDSIENGHVVELIAKGYKLKDLPAHAGAGLIRPAKVKVVRN